METIVYTSPRTQFNHIFEIVHSSEFELYYIRIVAYSEKLNLIGAFFTLEQAQKRVEQYTKVL